MQCSRRRFMVTSLSLVSAGCTTGSELVLPPPAWPHPRPRPRSDGALLEPEPDPARTDVATESSRIGPVRAIARQRWARGAPIRRRLNLLGRVSRITVHHEGWTAVTFDDWGQTTTRIDAIRRSHLARGFGDIGYHLVIDRAGRIWQGRAMHFQGAHVKHHNERNIGVMVLGNFDIQRPTSMQYTSLHNTLQQLTRYFRVPASRVYTHRELMPTTCPGHHLQQHMEHQRRRIG